LGQLAAQQRQLHSTGSKKNNHGNSSTRMSDSSNTNTAVSVRSDEALAHNGPEQEEMDAEMKEVRYNEYAMQ
jgi:hypothetical protein